MANTFLTPAIIAREALMQLRNNAVMSKLVYRDYSDDFVGAVGDTITIRKPATFVAKEFSTAIDVQDATENNVTVTMDKHLDVSFAVTSKELTLDIKDFSQQLIVPAMQAFNDKIDTLLIDLAKAKVTQRITHASSAGAITTAELVDARKFLVDHAAPTTDRNFVIGAVAEADLLKTDLFVSADKVGDNGTALREASIGRKYGMNFYTDQNIEKTSGETTDYTPSIAFHKNAFALVTRPLALPMGAKDAAIVNYDGFGLRVVYGYDMSSKKDTVSIDMLCGVKELDKDLAAIIDDQR